MNPQLFLKESNAIENVYDDNSLKQAVEAWKYLMAWDHLTVNNILQAHKKLMKDKLGKGELGCWRKCPIWVGGQEKLPWYAIPDLMRTWIKGANVTIEKGFPESEDEIKNDHKRFEDIHPFVDGNGRMGRILLNWQRSQVGLPILIIYEKEKDRYYKWFQ